MRTLDLATSNSVVGLSDLNDVQVGAVCTAAWLTGNNIAFTALAFQPERWCAVNALQLWESDGQRLRKCITFFFISIFVIIIF